MFVFFFKLCREFNFTGLRSSYMQGPHSDWKNWKGFSSQGILNRQEKSWNLWTNVIYYCLGILKWTVYYLLKWIKFSVEKQKFKKMTGNGNFASPKSGNDDLGMLGAYTDCQSDAALGKFNLFLGLVAIFKEKFVFIHCKCSAV